MTDSFSTTDNKQQTTDGNVFPSRAGVVFSSGFFGFFAHAGFLAALRELDINPVAYSGSSSGAILAAMAASGMSDKAIKEILFGLKKTDFWDPDEWHVIIKKALGLFRGYSGYLRGDKFGRLLERLPVRQIEDCVSPLAISATNLTTKQETIFTQGNLIKAIQASGAVPILFKPVEINGELYVDGGIVNKAPLNALANLVDLNQIIVHYIASDNLESFSHGFLNKMLTPWHIQHTAFNIARKEAYMNQLKIVRMKGVKVIEVKTAAPSTGPNRLKRGLSAYESAKSTTLKTLS
jgi:NTE family protein